MLTWVLFGFIGLLLSFDSFLVYIFMRASFCFLVRYIIASFLRFIWY
jgi:hypothetical protein